jgi:hypothetical protein
MTLKSEFKELVRKLLQLDMNVVVTARQKTLYADSGFMRKVGETFDGEKSLPYLFDTIVRLHRGPKGEFLGECLKDRSNRLPSGGFECTYPVLEQCFGRDMLEREPRPVVLASADQRHRIQQCIRELGLSDEKVQRRLAAYGADSLDALHEGAADQILTKLEAAAAGKSTTTSQEA